MLKSLSSSEESRRIVCEIGFVKILKIYLADYFAYIPGHCSLNIGPFISIEPHCNEMDLGIGIRWNERVILLIS
jgi:hypothetical protein